MQPANILDEEALQQNMFFWKHTCKQFFISALEILIQSRDASLGHLNSQAPLKQFGLVIENMNDLEILLTSFDSLVYPQPVPPPSSQGSGSKSADDGLTSPRAGSNSVSNFHKRLCVLVRTIRSLSLSLPVYAFLKNNKKNITKQNQQIANAQSTVRPDYQISVNKEKNLQKFPMKVEVKKQSLINLPYQFGTLSVQVEYISKNDIITCLSQPQPVQQAKNSSLQDMLMQALGPSSSNIQSSNNLSNVPQQLGIGMHGIHQQHQPSKFSHFKEDNRFRANSDTTYNHLPASKRRFKNTQQQMNNAYSPRVSEGIMIKEDYFTADKNKLFYQVSTKNSGNSYSSSQSNLSSENSKQFAASPFVGSTGLQGNQGLAQLAIQNQIKSSSLLKSSLDGGLIDPYDAPLASARPSKPKVDPFKKFDHVATSRNRNFRLSFDDGQRFKTQGSSSSLQQVAQAQVLGTSPPSHEMIGGLQPLQQREGGQKAYYRKGSMNIPFRNEFNSLPVEHQLIEEEDQNDFEINIQSDVSHHKGQGILDDQSSSKNQTLNNNKDATRSQSLLKIADENGNESFYYPSPIKSNSSDDEDENGYQILSRKTSQDHSGRKNSQIQFQRKSSKFIGFLEEISDEESSQNEDEDHMDEDQRIMKFQSKIQEFILQNKRSSGLSIQQQNSKEKGSGSKVQLMQQKSQQSELRDNFFNLLEMREMILEHANLDPKLQNYMPTYNK